MNSAMYHLINQIDYTQLPVLRNGQYITDYPQLGDITAMKHDPINGGFTFEYPNLWDVPANNVGLYAALIDVDEAGNQYMSWFPLKPPRRKVGWGDLFKAVAESLSQ